MKNVLVRARMLNKVRVIILLMYFCSFVARAQSIAADVQNHSRFARAIKKPPTIELLVVADESMVKFHGNATIRKYVLTIIAKVRYVKILYVKNAVVDLQYPDVWMLFASTPPSCPPLS